MEKIAAVIIWYNPKDLGFDKILFNISTYSDFFDKLYIVDNSQNDNSDICNFLSNSVYLQNKNKGGIGGAQNKGCQQAKNDGFNWVMTLDQDSNFDSKMIKNYIQLFNKYKTNNDIVSFGTEVKNLNEYIEYIKLFKIRVLSPIKHFFIPYKEVVRPEIEYKTFTIASGNIINLSMWDELHGFDEYLFIEDVDSDFCHRIINNNKKIAIFPSIVLNQCFGEKKKFTIIPKLMPIYSDFRYFYVFRNKMIQKRKYPEYKKSFKRNLIRFFVDYCINTIHPIKHFKIFIHAYYAYKKYVNNN